MMSLIVSWRYAYEDVALLASTDPAANEWRLEVESEAPRWLLVHAKILDSYMNWSTPDLTRWDELRRGEPSAIQQTFPDSTPGAPAKAPFAVTWDVSTWYMWPDTLTSREHRFRFIDPASNVFEFKLRSLQREQRHVFG